MSPTSYQSDILIVGAGVGGVGAALAALERDLTVVLTEEYRWIGGQLTVQATPPDEHPWIESMGATRNYRAFRDALRQHYRDNFTLSPRASEDTLLNPGNATVSKLAVTPDVSESVLREMLEPWIARGRLTVLTSTRPVAVEVRGDAVGDVRLTNSLTGDEIVASAPYVLDATELGDLLELAGVEYVSGSESQDETGEPHAPAIADPLNMQAFSWTYALGYDPHEDHTIARPAGYDEWARFRPPFWPAPYLSFTYPDPRTLEPMTADFAPHSDGPDEVLVADQSKDPGSRNLWVYRRALWRHNFANGSQPSDITIVNWPMTDYLGGPLFGVPEAEVAHHIAAAKNLSLSYLYWMQTEAPRPDGGAGWPGLTLLPEIMGTTDGLAMGPYVRESRRIRALRTIVEQDVSLAVRGEAGAVEYADSVGIGCYRIDLHPSTAGDNYIDIASAPFQIPLAALIPQRVTNLLAAAKNIGTTHITNGCYRLHPVEWSIGEAAAALVAQCLAGKTTPHAVAASERLTSNLQADLVAHGVELAWPDTVQGY